MSKYAKINSENIVENTIECSDSVIGEMKGTFIKITEATKDTSIGDTWDPINKKFILPKPYDSWSLDENFDWQAPVEWPGPGNIWDEETNSWISLKSE